MGYKILVDGGVSAESVRDLWKAGVDGFCLGNAGLFGKNRTYAQIIEELRSYPK